MAKCNQLTPVPFKELKITINYRLPYATNDWTTHSLGRLCVTLQVIASAKEILLCNSTLKSWKCITYTVCADTQTPTKLYNTYTLCSKKSDAKIQITTTTSNVIRIKRPLSSFNYCLAGTNVANFNKIHRTVYEQQPFQKWNSKTEVSNQENTN